MLKAVKELEAKLIDTKETTYNGIDTIMRKIMKKYNLTAKQLHNAFVNKHHQTPDDWIKANLSEGKNSKMRKHIEYAYDLGSKVPVSMGTHISQIQTMTPKEIDKHSGGGAVMKEINQAKKRRQKAIDKILKQHNERKSKLRKEGMSFIEFMCIVEEYYRPNEKLPSGKTPVQKATAKGIKGEKLSKVKRGADNPNLDRSSHPDLDVVRHPKDRNHVSITHKKSGIKFTLSRQKEKNKKGDHIHTMVWTHNRDESKGPMSDRDARQVVRDANTVWKSHIAHRFPHDSVVHNNPLPSYKAKGEDFQTTNPRARIYKRWGFGNPKGNPDKPDQWAKVKRPPSSKQLKKGKTRLTPIEDKNDSL